MSKAGAGGGGEGGGRGGYRRRSSRSQAAAHLRIGKHGDVKKKEPWSACVEPHNERRPSNGEREEEGGVKEIYNRLDAKPIQCRHQSGLSFTEVGKYVLLPPPDNNTSKTTLSTRSFVHCLCCGLFSLLRSLPFPRYLRLYRKVAGTD
eukprot:gene9346-6569_t